MSTIRVATTNGHRQMRLCKDGLTFCISEAVTMESHFAVTHKRSGLSGGVYSTLRAAERGLRLFEHSALRHPEYWTFTTERGCLRMRDRVSGMRRELKRLGRAVRKLGAMTRPA